LGRIVTAGAELGLTTLPASGGCSTMTVVGSPHGDTEHATTGFWHGLPSSQLNSDSAA
jgi:hypothetical protein